MTFDGEGEGNQGCKMKLHVGYEVMKRALLDTPEVCAKGDIDYRSWYMRYLDGCPLPLVNYSLFWDDVLTQEALRRLDVLTGPNGYVVARAFIIKTKDLWK